MLSEVWQPFVKTNYNERSLKKTFSKGGYCKLEFQLSKNTKLLVLNTIFFSKNYVNKCGDSLLDPGDKELEWLRKNLEQSKQKHNRIWLSYHIPPGIDVYGTINGKGNCEERILPVWKKNYNDEFLNIIKEYSDIIELSFAGHFHRDDFRIIYKDKIPVSYIHLAPSISPVYYNNPGYQVFTYQKSDFGLLDYETYFIENLSANGLINWRKEYDFRDSYNQTSLSLSSLNSINSLILSDSTYRATYIKYYSVSNIKSFQGDYTTWYYNWCGLGHLTTEEYAKCLCVDSTGAK